MANIPISLEIEYYNDPANYKPLASGNVYIGQPDTDPEVLGNRITVILRQENGTEVPLAPAAQPFQIGPGGRVLYNGSPAQLLVDQSYSIKITDNLGAQKYYVSKAGQVLDTPIQPVADEWTEGTQPTYISPTSFSVEGNLTATYHKGRRVRTTNTTGFTYSTVDSSAFDGTKTTVVVENTSGAIDIGLSAVAFGINAAINSSVPGDLNDIREIFVSKQITTPKQYINGAFLESPPLTAGTATAYTVTLNETALVTNRIYRMRIHVDNTGAATLSIDGITAIAIKTLAGVDPVAGQLKQNMDASFLYDGTNAVILNPATVSTEQIADRAVTNAKIRNAVTGTQVAAASDGEESSTATPIALIKEIYVPYGGTFSVYFELKSDTASFFADGRIYVNGAPAGTYRTTNSTVYVSYTEDIPVNPGDLVQLYTGRAGGSATSSVRNFRIREAQPLTFYVNS